MTRSLTLSLLTLISLSGLTMANAASPVQTKDTVTHLAVSLENSPVIQQASDEQKGKGDVPRPKPTPGPRDGNEE
jgi:hypothetical protein